MQLGFFSSPKASLAFPLALLLLLPGCNNGNAAGGRSSEGGAASTKTGAYVLVTQVRPEVPEKFFVSERHAHEVCATVARHQNRPVKPFPTLPADFVYERNTHASDGVRTMSRKVISVADTRNMSIDTGCEVRLATQGKHSVVSNGEEREAGWNEDGKVEISEPTPIGAEPVRASLLASYATPKRVHGVPLKCDAQGDCIIDSLVALVAEGVRPVVAVSRIDDVRTFGTVLVNEPVSFSTGKATDPTLFSLEAK